MKITNNNLDNKQILISGLALFAIFFGAGNLIIPPYLGYVSKEGWLMSSIGFNLSDSLLILLGILALSKNSASPKKFGSKISKNFGTGLVLVAITLVGPLLSIPRTAATTYEVAIANYYPNFNRVLFSLIFFALVYIITINGSKVIDRVGKYLTPILLAILLVLIASASRGENISINFSTDNIARGFTEGYQTMDSLGPIFLTGIILEDLRTKGFSKEDELKRATIYSGLIAVIGLSLVYTGLAYIGSKANFFVEGQMTRADILNIIAKTYLGNGVKAVLFIVVACACLSTAVGLTSAFAQNFTKSLPIKLTYKTYVRIGVILGFILSILGVEDIMAISVPILLFIYPIVITLYVLNLLDRGQFTKSLYRLEVIGVGLLGLADSLKALGFTDNFYTNLTNHLPLASYDLGFVFVGLLILILYQLGLKIKTYLRKS